MENFFEVYISANILNKQSRTADKGWSSILEFRRGPKNTHRKKISLLRNVTKGIGHGRIIWINDLS
jgi:hypothetical protein